MNKRKTRQGNKDKQHDEKGKKKFIVSKNEKAPFVKKPKKDASKRHDNTKPKSEKDEINIIIETPKKEAK